jgi:hypothetical protein
VLTAILTALLAIVLLVLTVASAYFALVMDRRVNQIIMWLVALVFAYDFWTVVFG